MESKLSRIIVPVIMEREKRRRPNEPMVEVIGTQVGAIGSPWTLCFLFSKRRLLFYINNNKIYIKNINPSISPFIMAFYGYDNGLPSNYHTSFRGHKHSRKHQQLVGVDEPLTLKLRKK